MDTELMKLISIGGKSYPELKFKSNVLCTWLYEAKGKHAVEIYDI